MRKSAIHCIMLVDDNKTDNFFHERAIKKYDSEINTIAFLSAIDALDHLKKVSEIPDVIFLDINMPGMNGWEFLEEYQKLDNDYKKSLVITMLSTSENPDDMEKASNFGVYFKSKPLTLEMLAETEEHYKEFKNNL